MPKINQVKLKQDADAAEKAGRFDKAIDALKQIVQENPRDWNTVNRIGDLYAKLSNTRAANEQYVKVARFLADDGFYLKAIALWKKVLRNDSSMLDGHMSLGDLYARQGLPAEAKQTFAFVFEEYKKRNKMREAGEVLQRMRDVDPSDMKVRIGLAELYVREGSAEKAAGEYGALADELVKKGLLAEALQLLEKALRNVPRSPRLLAAAARVHIVQKDFAKAVGLLEEARRAAPADREVALRLAEACLGARRGEEARRVLEALLQQDPSDLEARQQLGQVYLAEGRFDEAYDQLLPAVDKLVERRQIDRGAALLQQVVQRKPSHIRCLAKLVELYRQARNDVLVAQTYSQMVEAYLADGGLDQAASILEMLVQLEPHNEQHRTKLRWLREQQGQGGFEVDLQSPAPSASPAPAPVSAAPAPPPKPAAIELSGPLSADDQEFIGEHLAEGRVFRKYGLGDKARDQFEAVLGRFPDNVDALQELIDLQKDKGESEAAARRLRVLAEVLRLKGDAARAARADEEADRLVPPPAPAAAPAAAAAPAVEAPAPPRPPAPAAPAPSAAPRVAPAPRAAAPPRAASAPPPPAVPAAAVVPRAAPAPPAASPIVRSPAAKPVGDVEFDIPIEETPEEEPAFEDYPLEPEPEAEPARPGPEIPAAFDTDLEAGGSDIRTSFLEEEPGGFDLETEPTPATFTTALRVPGAAAASAAHDLPAELARGLGEIESYVAMGFVDDAKGVLQDLVSRFGAHASLVERMSGLGLELPGAAAAPAAISEADAGLGDLVEVPAPEPPPAPVARRVPVPSPARAARRAPAPPAARPQPPPPADEPMEVDLFSDFGAPAAAPPPSPAAFGLGAESLPEPESQDEITIPAAPAPGAAHGGFDLASELGDLFSAQPAVADEPPAAAGTDFGDDALADIFREFQKGVDKQLGKEDYETRYNLGIAYKEMGLVDEAIAEFQLAAKDESRMLECASMLGICFIEKGMPKLAVKWFEKGLSAPGRTDEEYQALRYDLASALEQAGDVDRALALFTDLWGQDASFRDVADRVRQLGASR